MERLDLTVGVVLVVAATAATVSLLNATGATAPAWIAAAVLMVATGLVVNRVWAAAVPFALLLALVAFVLFAYVGEPGDDVITLGDTALWSAALVVGIPLCFLIGVGLRRLARRNGPAQRSGFSPQNDA